MRNVVGMATRPPRNLGNTMSKSYPPPPSLEKASEVTRVLHDGVDAFAQSSHAAYLNPESPTVQVDLFHGDRVADWQNAKASAAMLGTTSAATLDPIYARYATFDTNRLIQSIIEIEKCEAALVTDSGMQACALVMDALIRPGSHVIMSEQVYAKTKSYLEWTAARMDIEFNYVDHITPEVLKRDVRSNTTLVLGETFSNPLMRALDLQELSETIVSLRDSVAPGLRFVIDHTIASPYGAKKALLDHDGIDAVLAAGTKAMAGNDQDIWGYVASNRLGLINILSDLQSMRGGVLSWRSARVLEKHIKQTEKLFEKRCQSAIEVVRYLEGNNLVSEIFHPSTASHPDHKIAMSQYKNLGSLLSFRLADAETEADVGHFCNVLAMTRVFRYALSFDGLVSKVNHHTTVSEFFTPPGKLRSLNIDRLVRLAIGTEDPKDLIRALEWAFENAKAISAEDVEAWAAERAQHIYPEQSASNS